MPYLVLKYKVAFEVMVLEIVLLKVNLSEIIVPFCPIERGAGCGLELVLALVCILG